MNPAEVLQLCRMVKAFCPSQTFDSFSPDAWALILGGHPFDDARAAVVAIAGAELEPGKSRYIEPGHIVGGIKRIRGRRLAETVFPEPPAGLDAAEYATWETRTREAIAAGTYQPEQQKAIDAAMPGRVDALIREARKSLPQSTIPKAARPERRSAINDEEAERERARQIAALEAHAHRIADMRNTNTEQEQQQ